MSEKTIRLSKVLKELSVGIDTAVEYLAKIGMSIPRDLNEKLSEEAYTALMKEFRPDLEAKMEADKKVLPSHEKQLISIETVNRKVTETPEKMEEDNEIIIKDSSPKLTGPKVLGKIDIPEKTSPKEKAAVPEKEVEKTEKPAPEKGKKAKVEEDQPATEIAEKTKPKGVNIVGKIDLEETSDKKKKGKKSKKEEAETAPVEEEVAVPEITETPVEETPVVAAEQEDANHIKTEIPTLNKPVVIGKIDLATVNPAKPKNERDYRKNKEAQKNEKKQQPGTKSQETTAPKAAGDKTAPVSADKRKRKRIHKEGSESIPVTETDASKARTSRDKRKRRQSVPEIDLNEIDQNVKATWASATFKEKSKTAKYRKEKRDAIQQKIQEEQDRMDGERNLIRITEFATVNEMSSLMNIPVNQVIQKCFDIGLMVSINQRLDADTVTFVADEFGFKVEFSTDEIEGKIETEADRPEDLEPRPPIVTVMGHVDHGKTKLLDFIRNANVVAGEAGGITQHIGAYNVTLDNGRKITFLDTPGHEAFTAMRARGAKVTDVAIIVIAADDGVKPQTIEAINHAHAAGVKIVFALNKIDKPESNPDRVREQLANMNFLVEEWGGKYQSQEIAAKPGKNVDLLLEKVLLEAELLDLKANPNKRAFGTVLESSLDKGRGFVATVLIHEGTLHIGDIVVAGPHYGRVKAMFNERNLKIKEAGPSMPVQILGIDGAPQAGDILNSMADEHEAKEIANKRSQILREQGLRTQKHVTLEEIGRRIAIGGFKELNVIVKGDVDGSIEALSDSLIKLTNEEIAVNVIHKAVGQISDSDVMLATASNAIIVGFQVRPSVSARKIAEKEQIQIKLYSVIYDAIEELKQAMEGMLSPIIKEEVIGTAEVRETFHIGKVGNIAGCLVTDGKIVRTARVRLIRDGIVAYTGNLGSLKRFKDDVKDVQSGLECGLNITGFNDIKTGDIIEAFVEKEEKKKL
jgi:translation initiation factor IF-2